jgi:hypothetical protein
MPEIGKIDKPEADQFAGKKKLYFVRIIYLMEQSPEEYAKLFSSYWDEINEQVDKMATAGEISKLFCESLLSTSKNALETFDRMNERAGQLIRKRIRQGAELIPFEKEEIFGPLLDWSNCLMVVQTKEVFDKIITIYNELSTQRGEHITQTIDKNLASGETGLLLMKDEDRIKLQFPKDVELFLVTPPSYDDILKWFREEMRKRQEKEAPRDMENQQ